MKQIPNILTLLNLCCGCLSIICSFNYEWLWMSYFIFIAGFLDFFDGFIARMLKAQSELGKQLDSLADVVTFGVAPGFIIYQLLSTDNKSFENGFFTDISFYVFLLIPCFAAYRLAKFNISTSQSYNFIGMPTPAFALVIASFPLVVLNRGIFQNLVQDHTFLRFFTVFGSLLLISNLHIMALKFKNFSLRENIFKYLLFIIGLLLILVYQFDGIIILFIVYIVLSLIEGIYKNKVNKQI